LHYYEISAAILSPILGQKRGLKSRSNMKSRCNISLYGYMAKVFISYSRKDINFAKRLTGELQKSDLDVWIDWEEIPPTVDWWKEIEKGIEESDAFLFIISPDSTSSKICKQEIDHAIKNGKRIIPIVVREVNWEDTPPQLGHLTISSSAGVMTSIPR